MDFVEATQVLRDEAPPNDAPDETRVGTLKIGSQTHIICRGFNRIGRSPQCPVVINDVTVSKVHAEIQAGAEAAFVSDLRSSNGTKIKDVPIKPFYYYSINDGDAIYFGQVKAVYATARSAATEDVPLVPETPVGPRNRNATERFSAGAANISESFLNNSSVYESDASMIPGTQEAERKRPIFQRPSTPVQRSPSSRRVAAPNGSKGRDDVEAAPQPPGAKRPRLQDRSAPSGETRATQSPVAGRKEPAHHADDIFEAETQRVPISISEENHFEEPKNRDDIFEVETQALPAAMSKKNKLDERGNQEDIFEAETQVSSAAMRKKNKLDERGNQEDIFEAETQALPVAMGKKNKLENQDDIFEAETQVSSAAMGKKNKLDERENQDDIIEAETQVSSTAMSKKNKLESRKNQDDIFEAETQTLPVAMGKKNKLESRKNQDDIFEAETQTLPDAMKKKNKLENRENRDDIFEAETQALPVAMKKKNKLENRENRDDIFEAETQALPAATKKKNKLENRENRDDIFEAETQALPVAMKKKNKLENRENRDDIFEAETQALPVAMKKKNKLENRENRDDIFEAETQALPVAMKKKNKLENRDDIFEAETQAMEVSIPESPSGICEAETEAADVETPGEPNSIFEAETQAMEISVPKSGEKIDKRPGVKILEPKNRTSSGRGTNSVHEAETQIAQVQISSSDSDEPIGMQENIHELATQILDRKRTSTGGGSVRLNETAESSFRSSSSRDRLRLSSTPPSSPEIVEVEESQNLLEIAETPLLAYERSSEKISSVEDVPVAVEESKVGEKKSRVFRRVRTIPESSESETDDEKVSPRFVRKSKPSNVIEDSSEEPTDEENVFGGSPMARASARDAGPVAAAGDRPEPSGERRSPLRTRKSEERDSNEGGKKNVSVSGDSPKCPSRRNDGISRTEVRGTPPRGRGESGDSSTDSERRNDGISRTEVRGTPPRGRGESGDSPADSERRNDGISRTEVHGTSPRGRGESGRSSVRPMGGKDRDWPAKNGGKTSEAAEAKADFLGDSPSGHEISPKKIEAASTSKFGRSPLRLRRNVDGDSPKKNEQGASGRGATKPKLFGDSPKKDNGSASNNREEAGQKNSKKIGDSPRTNDSSENPGESSGEPKNSKKFGDSPGRTKGSPVKIQAEKSAKFQLLSNILGRPSLRLSRKADDPSPKKITKKSAKEEEDDIFAATTQRVVYGSVGNESAARADDEREGSTTRNDEIDIDLLPTQILDVPSSTPLSRKSSYRQNRSGAKLLDGDDLHSAPTQILKESPRSENTDDHEQLHGKDLHVTPSRILRKSPPSGSADLDRNKTKHGAKTIDLDDSLATNLGNLLGEEANNDCLDDDGTQMMTQNLVDILRPTQSFTEDTGNGKSSPRTSASYFGRRSGSPGRKKIFAHGTLGFVDGEARNSSRELVSADPSPIKAVAEIAAPSAKIDEHDEPARVDPDDIFAGLPEVRISGTLSNPGSPASSSSSAADVPAPSRKRPGWSRCDSPDSPVTPKKSRVTRRPAASYRILEDEPDDSEEDFDYLDLKRMADRLLASDSRCEGKSRRPTTRPGADDKFAKIPVPIARKKIGATDRRAVELSGGSSSSNVSGGDDRTSAGSADSSAGPRKPARGRKRTANKTVAVMGPSDGKKEQGGEESQEVEAILGNAVEDNRPMVSRKSYAKIKMAKRNVGDKEDGAVTEAPKVTRKRRTVSVSRKIQETPVATPTRVRRTIAGTPGIPGDDGDRKILFTGVRDDKYDRIVEKLGGTVVSDPSEATVLITDKVRRTFKFLCAVARGIRVVSINWLLESGKSSRFLDCERFILKEAAAEAKYKFSLEKSLRIARTKKLLDGYTIIVTPKVNQPEIHELKGMVEACGGRLLVRPGRSWSAKTVVISREEDHAVAKAYLAKAPKNLKITVQSTEFILTGILRQEINLVEHELKFL